MRCLLPLASVVIVSTNLCLADQARAAAAAESRAPAASLAPSFSEYASGDKYAGPSPYLAIDRVDLRAGSRTETGRALSAALPSINYPRPAVADGSDHLPPLTLRGLSPDHTLVTVNGVRRHTTALLNVNGTIGRGSMTTSLAALPLSALEKIEVLLDGADVRFASGAFGGVINLEMREDLGRELSAFVGQTAEGDGGTRMVRFNVGSLLGERGVVNVTTSWRERDETDRAGTDTRQQYFGTEVASGRKTALSGAYASGISAPPAGVVFDPKEATANREVQRYGDAKTREYGAAANARLPLGNNHEFFTFGDFLQLRGEGSAYFRRPGDSRVVRALWPDGFMPLLETRIDDWFIAGGWRGRNQGWKYNATVNYGANTIAYDVSNTNNASLGVQSPRQFYAGKLGNAQGIASADLSHDLPLGLAKPAELAVGLEYRREQYWIGAGSPDSWRNGGVPILDGPEAGSRAADGAQGFPGFRPTDAVDASRRVSGAHVEISQGVNERLLLAVAARYEKSSDLGETTDGKAAARLALWGGVTLRGSVATSYRLPHLAQKWFSSTATNFIGGQVFETRTFPVSDPVARALGATDLIPEHANTMSAGLAWAPGAALALEVDFYRLDVRDRIILSSNFVGSAVATMLESKGVSGTSGGRFFSNDAATRSEGVDARARWTWQRAPKDRLVLDAAYNRNRTRMTRVGDTPAGLAALGVTTPLFDLTEEIRLTRGQPRNHLRLGGTWEMGRVQVALHASHYGEMEVVALSNASADQIAALSPGFTTYTVTQTLKQVTVGGGGAPQIGGPTTVTQLVQVFDAKWLTDLDVSFKLTDALRWSVGASNLFDVYPTKSLASRVVNGRAYSGADNAGTTPYNAMMPFGFNGAFFYSRMNLRF